MALVKTFAKKDNHWVPITVEVSLIQGLPKLEFIGLPDSAIKESEWRLRSAFRSQGFRFPSTMKTIINLRPTYFKKNSAGVDLAIALAILLETKQTTINLEKAFVYGELGLDANVYSPGDIEELVELPGGAEFLMCGNDQGPVGISYWGVRNLSEIRESPKVLTENSKLIWRRPSLEKLKINKQQAELLKYSVLGNFSCLVAGPQGSGKTSLLREVYKLLATPSEQEGKEIRKWQTYFNCKTDWRSFVDPHHSSTPLSIIGGGSNAYPGEITRAHRGVFLLDELLEFNSYVLESLREVISTQKITVTRVGKRLRYPADILLLATTNLCRCGKYTPKKIAACKCSPKNLRAYLDRLSGPILDRFKLLSFSDNWSANRQLELSEVGEEILHWQKSEKLLKCYSSLTAKELDELQDSSAKLFLMELPENLSLRRLLAIKQLACLIANLEGRKKYTDHDLAKAYEHSIGSFEKLYLQSI